MQTVSSVDHVIENIRLYEKVLSRSPQMQGRIRRHAAWYAFRDDGVWRFGPSKFIGYEGMTAKDYLVTAKESLDGRKTEDQLERWFPLVNPASDLFSELQRVFKTFAGKYGKEPKKTWRVRLVSLPGLALPAARTDTDLSGIVVSNPEICGGRPTIRGTRVRVSDIVDMMAHGTTPEEIVEAYPYISTDDIRAALAFAARMLDHPVVKAA